MDYFTEYKLSKYKEIEPLSAKGTTVLVYDTVERQLFVKKVVNEKIYNIYKKINDIECDYMPKIIDTIKAEDEYIIIEEFIKGDSVDYLIKQNGVFSEEKAVSYIIDIGEALKQIHGRNIVHRDITPNNVIIDENDRAVLLDFDIARMEDKSESRDTTLLGTAGFASPEQYGFAPTDTRGDIFSMGALLNFMLTGDVVQKKIYTVTGHGEGSLSTTITDLMTKNNYTTEELNLLMKDSIPDDCDLLLMDGPTNDLSDDEVSLLSGYLGEGGKVMCLLGDTGLASLPKLAGLLKDYGIEGADGYIADPQRCYQNQPYYIFPVLNLSGDMADGISSQMVLLMNSRGLTTTDPARDTITTSAFMTTSEQAYAVTEEDQKQGTYDLGVVATETISSDSKESRLTVISAGSLIDQQITDAFSQLENTQVFMNAVTANFDGVTNLSIEAKSLTTEYNTVQHAGGFSILVVFGIPAVVLIGGFVVWFRRRKA